MGRIFVWKKSSHFHFIYSTLLVALKRETQNFVTSLYANAASSLEADPTFAGNRVGIISFGGFANDDTGGWKDVYTDKESLIATIESLQMNNNSDYRVTV